MALPYKLFKSLTIDGTTFGLDPDLGKRVATDFKKFNLSPNTRTEGAKITITEAGTYYIGAHAFFSSPSTTGNAYITVDIEQKKAGESSWTYTNSNSGGVTGGESQGREVPCIISFTESEVPAEVRTSLMSTVQRNNSDSTVYAVKLISTQG